MKAIKTLLAVGVLAGVAATQASATTYDVGGTWSIAVPLYGSTYNFAMQAFSGTYDSVSGLGNWHVSADISSLFPGTVINWDQTYSIDSTTGLGTLNAGTNCTGTGNSGLACGGVAGNFVGPITNLGGPIVAGAQSWSVLTPVTPTPIVFSPTLTAQAPAVPVPAAAWLFGSGLLGLAGTARRRSK